MAATQANKTSAKKTTTRKTTAKKATARKTTAKKATARKTTARKTTTQSKAAKQQKAVTKAVNNNIDNAQDIAKKVYLASLGAFGRTVDEAQERFDQINSELTSRYKKINKDGQKLMKDLVNRGEKVQDEAEDLVRESRANIEQQIEKAKDRLSGYVSVSDISDRLKEMSNKLESLSKDLKKSA